MAFRVSTTADLFPSSPSLALTALKAHIGWRYCLLVLGLSQASVFGCGMLLRPIVIRPDSATKGENSNTNAEILSLKQLEAIHRLESEQTRSSLSSGTSQGSQDSGVTSLSASNMELRAVCLEEKGTALDPLSSTPSSTKEDVQGTSFLVYPMIHGTCFAVNSTIYLLYIEHFNFITQRPHSVKMKSTRQFKGSTYILY